MKIIFVLILFIFSDAFAVTDELYKCLDIKDIELEIEYDQVAGRDVCDIGFRIISTNPNYFYATRNWRSPAYCQKLIFEWKRIKQERKTACVAGYLFAEPRKEKYKNKEVMVQSGFWEVIKTNNWCHTYFVGNCQGVQNAHESF